MRVEMVELPWLQMDGGVQFDKVSVVMRTLLALYQDHSGSDPGVSPAELGRLVGF